MIPRVRRKARKMIQNKPLKPLLLPETRRKEKELLRRKENELMRSGEGD